MGIKRVVDVGFWNDEKVLELFTPEDKLFFLYLMTNPHTTQLGIYAITVKHMAFEIGYSTEAMNALIDRFEKRYGVIKYSKKTREIAIKNYLKYSIIKGGKPVEDLLKREISQIKDKSLLKFVYDSINDYENLNETVKTLLPLFYENENKKDNEDDNDNDNDNDNDVSYHESYHDSSNESLDDEFERVWSLYPNKKGKKDAFKAYKKARTRKKNAVTFEKVEAGVKAYCNYVKMNKTDVQYMKHGSTWFNQECWNDEYTIQQNTMNEGGNMHKLSNGAETNNIFIAMMDEERNNHSPFNLNDNTPSF